MGCVRPELLSTLERQWTFVAAIAISWRTTSEEPERMAAFKGVEFSERQSAASNAKKTLLEKFRAKPGPGDPHFDKRQTERQAAAEERNAARARALKKKQEAREAALRAEEAAREAEAAARAELEAKRHAELEAEAVAKVAREAEAKVARDARYAARKARK
jgi:hypothetical protein